MTTNNTNVTKGASCATRRCRRWHNESDRNCDYPGGMDECASFTPELTAVEKELLRMLEARKPLWPFDAATDRNYVHKLYTLYGAEINLVEKFFLWESYYISKSGAGNPRLAFHKWCIKGVELKKKYETPKRAMEGSNRYLQSPGVPTSTPRRREAGHAAPAPGINNVNALAAGIVKEKTGTNPTLPLPLERGGKQFTQGELEARRQKMLADYRNKKENGNAE